MTEKARALGRGGLLRPGLPPGLQRHPQGAVRGRVRGGGTRQSLLRELGTIHEYSISRIKTGSWRGRAAGWADYLGPEQNPGRLVTVETDGGWLVFEIYAQAGFESALERVIDGFTALSGERVPLKTGPPQGWQRCD